MKVLDLFSGIGGFSLGLERAGMETVAFCEYDDKARQVLRKHWPDVPQYNDVRTLTKEQLENDGIESIRLICGGYPCQPFSTAGRRQGEDDDRHLWPELFRLVQEIRPAWVLCENVAGHITMGLDSVLADLEGEGYSAQTFVIPACAVGAYHRRDRVWIIAHREGAAKALYDPSMRRREERSLEREGASQSVQDALEGRSDDNRKRSGRVMGHPSLMFSHVSHCYGENGPSEASESGNAGSENDVADTSSVRQQGQGLHGRPIDSEKDSDRQADWFDYSGKGNKAEWLPEPAVGRVAHGVPGRVDRLKQLGNAVVPQVVEVIGRAIMEAENASP